MDMLTTDISSLGYKAVKENSVIPFGPMLSLAGLVIFILQTLQLTF